MNKENNKENIQQIVDEMFKILGFSRVKPDKDKTADNEQQQPDQIETTNNE